MLLALVDGGRRVEHPTDDFMAEIGYNSWWFVTWDLLEGFVRMLGGSGVLCGMCTFCRHWVDV